jgi:hypothetical protein
MHVCMSCYERYDGKFLRDIRDFGEIFCPRVDCHGDVVELDELIAPTIILLNQKGYLTKFCCSGHWYEYSSNAYIYFYEDCIPEAIPASFKIDEHSKDVIRARYEANENESKYDFVIRINKELYEWASSLPECEW